MSSRGAKKNVPNTKATNTITTRNKSALQNRQLRAKTKKTEKPLPTKQTSNKTGKSPKAKKNDMCCKDSPLKTKVRNLAKLVEQVEYYPDKLKRDLCSKKIMLKPKHNFKVIASANKRKLTVPQRGDIGGGMKSPPPLKKLRGSSGKMLKGKSANIDRRAEISIPDMVRLIEDTHSLSDEDFMEILTCPSPVWWEDPPDDEYTEDAIFTRPPDPSPVSSTDNNSIVKEQKHKTSQPKNKTKLKTSNKNEKITQIDFENEIEEFKISPTMNKCEKFNSKKQKLEKILGSIKIGKNTKTTCEIKNVASNSSRKRKVSTSTDGEDLSDLSLNEEEVLRNLENMDIPIEQSNEQNDDKNNITLNKIDADNIIETKQEIKIDNELTVPDVLPTLTRKPIIKVEKPIKSENSDSNSEFYLDNVSHSNFRFISDDDSIDASNGNENGQNIGSIVSSVDESSSTIDVDTIDGNVTDYEVKKEQMDSNITGTNNNIFFRKKVINDLSEYITVYKIMSHDEKTESNETLNKCSENTSSNVRGKLNSFFKKRKNNIRLKKSDSSNPAILATDVKMQKENEGQASVENDENRLNTCDNCVVKTENGIKKFPCEKCEDAPIFVCDLCNFLADTKELYKKHLSSCKELARISWKSNLLTNQT